MNDPGLDEPINQESSSLEKKFEGEQEEDAEEDSLAPNRWWFASTAFPLIAGTFGPMANAFSICALVSKWRVSIPPGGVEEHGDPIPDPKWLLAVNGLSLVFGLLGNISLLLNMARRLSFSIAQPLTILSWYTASLTLLTLVGLASTELRLPSPPAHALSQAFYYGLMAGVIYFLIASLMVVTVLGAYKGHYPREFKLTLSQRTLMLQTIAFLTYLLSGAAVFAHIEKWQYLDAVYWADFTMLTVGIGDYAPMTHEGRSLLFPYAIGGIVMLGLVIGSVRALVLEKGKRKVGKRLVEKERVRLLEELRRRQGRGRKKNVLTPIRGKGFKRGSGSEEAEEAESSTDSASGGSTDELERRKEEFHLMRRVQEKAATTRRWTSLAISFACWLTLWFLGALVFMYAEHGQRWSYFQSLYFAYVSLLTIGYGDLVPMSNSGKPFFVFWSLLAIPTMTVLISNMGDTIVKWIRDLTLWVGEVTVLPGEHPVKVALKRGVAKVTGGKIGDVEDGDGDGGGEDNNTGIGASPAGMLGDQSKEAGAGRGDHHLDIGKIDQAAAQPKAAAELDSEDAARHQGNISEADRHRYAYVLIKEIRRVMGHLNENPPKQYSFEEWAWFLRLLGEDESVAEGHREARPGARERRESFDRVKEGGGKWSWLGKRSPLLAGKTESEWVLERLTGRLEQELERRRGEGGEGEKRREEDQNEREDR